MKNIFVRGISRSGGTLMATVLDAHPQIAMCYEIYPHLLEHEGGTDAVIRELKGALKKSRLWFIKPAAAGESIQKFVGRVTRGGTSGEHLLELLHEHRKEGRGFDTFEDRMRFIERLADDKARVEHKLHWGTKITSCYDQVQAMYGENAYFLFMLRDGRDVAASRKKVGDFRQSPEEIATAWFKQLRTFQEFAQQPGVKARLVHYERLASQPERELRGIVEFLDLPWDERVANFHQQDLSLYRNPTGHLSATAVQQPISTTSVGRWMRDLTPEEIRAFESVAGEQLQSCGYQLS